MDYVVSIDNEESNKLADILSITGRVNGLDCAAKVRLSALRVLPDDKARKQAKQKALIAAFNARSQSAVSAGEKVTL